VVECGGDQTSQDQNTKIMILFKLAKQSGCNYIVFVMRGMIKFVF